MSKKSRGRYSNLYENDILDLDTIEELENILPIKENKSIKRAIKEKGKPKDNLSHNIVITKPVEATCNKCNNKIIGELISDIYMPHLDKVVPLISYTCKVCGHIGRRSVVSLALPLNQYEKKYFN